MSAAPLQKAIDSVKHWYIPLIIGILLILLGIYVFSTPITSYLALAVTFSVIFLLSGILQVAFSIANRHTLHSWGWYLASGLLYTLIGLLLFSRPDISMATLPFVVGFFVLFQSANALGWAYDLKQLGVSSWGNLALFGVLGLILSFILLWNPVFAGLSLVIWTGAAFIFAGLGCIWLSLRLRKLKNLSGRLFADHEKK
ncbi:MAG TPA: DUF308 domain-containing protein [Puia sp.]|nr:DUF308 domain-containing protein [Puia sp.]